MTRAGRERMRRLTVICLTLLTLGWAGILAWPIWQDPWSNIHAAIGVGLLMWMPGLVGYALGRGRKQEP